MMRHLTTLVLIASAVCSLSAAPNSAFAVEADISGNLVGWLSLDDGGIYSVGQIYGTGQLRNLEHSHLTAEMLVNNAFLPYISAYPQLAEYAFVLSELRLRAANGDTIDGLCGPTMYDVNTGRLSWDIIFWGARAGLLAPPVVQRSCSSCLCKTGTTASSTRTANSN